MQLHCSHKMQKYNKYKNRNKNHFIVNRTLSIKNENYIYNKDINVNS